MDATSLTAEGQDVDKSLFDAEQFLSNFTTLREECERLKAENHELQIRVQQLSQDQNQLQIDKQNLERHIQKETLRHKETVWNLKLEVQKSQEERLSWKEKFLDLCIKSSQNNSMMSSNGETTPINNSDKDKKGNKKTRGKKLGRKKVKVEKELNDVTVQLQAAEESVLAQESVEFVQSKGDLTDPNQVQPDQHPTDMSDVGQVVVERLSLETSLPDDGSNMNTVDMVTPLDTKFNNTNDMQQAHVVTTDATDYYSLQPAPFNLDGQGQPVSANTTTFILQTSDATFCATAVMDEQQRAQFGQAAVPFELKQQSPNAFTTQATFPETQPMSDSESDENTEFNFRCSMCNFTYSDQAGLDKHIKAKHSAKTNFCKECGKAYSTKGSLAQHVHHYHRHPMAYNCDVCDKKFNRKDFLIKHIKTHTQDRSFPCTHCDKQFKTSASLSAHVNGSHNDKRRFVCDFCGMRTSWRLSYLEHMKLHTGEPRKTGRKKKEQQQQQQQQQQQLVAQQQDIPTQQLTQDIQQLVKNQELQQLVKSQELTQLVKNQDLQQLVGDDGAVVQFITSANG